jgi:mannose-1-phosphate guanylyltransferase/phosphomannomutase
VKIRQPYDDNWLLVLPDASEPLVRVFANVTESINHECAALVEQNIQTICEHIESFCTLKSATVAHDD